MGDHYDYSEKQPSPGVVQGGGPTAEDAAAYAADAALAPADAENILAQITGVARQARAAMVEVAAAEAALKDAQERLRLLTERQLPELMAAARQDFLTTEPDEAGVRWDLQRGENLRASIPPGNVPAGVMWLRGNGAGAIVKNELKLLFGMGQEQKAAECLSVLRAAGFQPDDKVFVHPMTLASTLNEMIEQGVDVPMGLLGAHVMPFVKIKPHVARDRPRRAGKR